MCTVSILIGPTGFEFPMAGRPEKGDVMFLSYILEDGMSEECHGYREYGFKDEFPEDILIRFDSIMITPDDSADYFISDWTLVDWRDIPVDKVNARLRDYEPHNLLVTAEINLFAKNESDLNKEVTDVKNFINKAILDSGYVVRVQTKVIENKGYKKAD